MNIRLMRMLLLTAATLASGPVLSGPVLAQGSDAGNPPIGAAQAARPERGSMAPVDRHIASLQRQLKITPAQQPQWDAFTAVMRQNAAHMETLQRERADKIASLSAPEDMRSYAELARSQAEDLQRLIPAFDELYASMSPEQKAAADHAFHESQGRGARARPRPS